MESTYGDRLHRSWEDSMREFHGVLNMPPTAGAIF